MKRVIALFLLTALTLGCGKSDQSTVNADKDNPSKPTNDEAQLCVVDFMNQCGCKDVEFSNFTDQAEVPEKAKSNGDSWAYQFSATYKNLFGETQKTHNWLAVVCRDGGKVKVLNCYDEMKQPISQHNGQEESEKVKLTAPTGINLPETSANVPAAIIAPKP